MRYKNTWIDWFLKTDRSNEQLLIEHEKRKGAAELIIYIKFQSEEKQNEPQS
jgi:hypothetical protein